MADQSETEDVLAELRDAAFLMQVRSRTVRSGWQAVPGAVRAAVWVLAVYVLVSVPVVAVWLFSMVAS